MWFRWLMILLSFLSEALIAADREAIFPNWAKKELVPWFNSQPDQFFTSAVVTPQPVILRYKSFLKNTARGQIVLVHGYGERSEKFMELAYDFYQADYNVFVYDQRGFGRSTRLNPEGKDSIYVESFDHYARDLEQFLVQVVRAPGSQPTFLFAHSMGGLVTTLLLHARPDLVKAAVLSAPMFTIPTRGVPRTMATLMTRIADQLGFGSSYAFGQVGPRRPEYTASSGTLSRPRWQFYADFYSSPEEWPRSLGGASFRWLHEALRGTELVDHDEWAAQVQTPILLFQAEHETFVGSEGQDAFCLRAAQCRKIFVPGTRHEIYREQDAARAPYLLTIWQFLEEHAGSGRNPATHH
ncbi:MAG TPA: alpha/beta fold hydrolase [Oligoflexus sp.]|uniref:alpha/beta fold hydrolase n=1 Tax=Oligoflexus sp. TaxID=1971216 RepID=UPI002D5B6D3E|nr:alpha/beta fold hydrolase [Oligoflexus sp.]HYX31651.1 alpha/beta fold hydrolase [Oligoflexus sp.]